MHNKHTIIHVKTKGVEVSRPFQIKITEDVSIILNNVVSYAVEKELTYRKLKDGAVANEKGNYSEEDFILLSADTISMYFIGGDGLTFRVGDEITAEDFIRVGKSLKALEFKLKEDSEGK